MAVLALLSNFDELTTLECVVLLIFVDCNYWGRCTVIVSRGDFVFTGAARRTIGTIRMAKGPLANPVRVRFFLHVSCHTVKMTRRGRL